MPVYIYQAIDSQSNKMTEGRLEAENLRAAKDMLREQGHIPTKLEEDQQAFNVGNLVQQIPLIGNLLAPRVGLKDINIMTQQLATLLDAGIPLIEGLFILEQQTVNKRLKYVLKKIRTDVITGDSFSVALSRFPQEFSRIYVTMMRAGEVSGDIDNICKRIAGLMEKNMQLRAKIINALTYPAFTVLIIVGVVIFIMLSIVPQFEAFFSNNGAELPLPTLVLIAISDFMQNFWWALLVGLGSLGFWFNTFRLGPGKPLVDQWILTIPLLGDTITKVYASHFVRTLSTVLSAGVSMTEALATAAGTIDNYVLRAAFDKARDSLLQGGTLGRPLEQTGVLPLMVTKMIAIGEETGKMETMLNKSADFLDLEVDTATEALTKLIEPLMIVVLGGVLLGVALALYVPLFDAHKVVS